MDREIELRAAFMTLLSAGSHILSDYAAIAVIDKAWREVANELRPKHRGVLQKWIVNVSTSEPFTVYTAVQDWRY